MQVWRILDYGCAMDTCFIGIFMNIHFKTEPPFDKILCSE
jgi:hypothetical protein